MEKIDLGFIKVTHRFRNGVDEKMRLFTKRQKEMILSEVQKRSIGIKIEDVLKMYQISPVVYHSWVRNKEKLLQPVKTVTILNNTISELQMEVVNLNEKILQYQEGLNFIKYHIEYVKRYNEGLDKLTEVINDTIERCPK
jgi:hypothetical protein